MDLRMREAIFFTFDLIVSRTAASFPPRFEGPFRVGDDFFEGPVSPSAGLLPFGFAVVPRAIAVVCFRALSCSLDGPVGLRVPLPPVVCRELALSFFAGEIAERRLIAICPVLLSRYEGVCKSESVALFLFRRKGERMDDRAASLLKIFLGAR